MKTLAAFYGKISEKNPRLVRNIIFAVVTSATTLAVIELSKTKAGSFLIVWAILAPCTLVVAGFFLGLGIAFAFKQMHVFPSGLHIGIQMIPGGPPQQGDDSGPEPPPNLRGYYGGGRG